MNWWRGERQVSSAAYASANMAHIDCLCRNYLPGHFPHLHTTLAHTALSLGMAAPWTISGRYRVAVLRGRSSALNAAALAVAVV